MAHYARMDVTGMNLFIVLFILAVLVGNSGYHLLTGTVGWRKK